MTRPRLRWLQAVWAVALLNAPASAQSDAPTRADRGKVLVKRVCGSCHAVERTGASSHPAAPAFRRRERNVDLDSFHERLREGLFSGHRDMPQFRLSREEARAVQAYLRAIQAR
ncbi:MAG: cytochrome c [Pseudorhodoplanes sp.]